MSHRKHGLRALGLCLLVALSVMAFAVAVAQGEPGGEWDINAKPLGELPNNEEKINAESDAGFTYLLAVPKLLTEIHCKKMVLEESRIVVTALGHGTLLFSECKVLPETCAVLEPITVKVKALLLLHEESGFGLRAFILFAPLTAGTPFVKLHFIGVECVLPVEVEVNGSVVAACLAGAAPAGFCETSQVKHLIETNAAIDSLFSGKIEGGKILSKDGLTFGANSMVFTSRTILFLSGGDVGKPWATLAP